MSVTVNVVVPDGALSVLRTDPSEFGEELKRAAVSKWYEMGMVSQSKGAEILGISRSEFLDVLLALPRLAFPGRRRGSRGRAKAWLKFG